MRRSRVTRLAISGRSAVSGTTSTPRPNFSSRYCDSPTKSKRSAPAPNRTSTSISLPSSCSSRAYEPKRAMLSTWYRSLGFVFQRPEDIERFSAGFHRLHIPAVNLLLLPERFNLLLVVRRGKLHNRCRCSHRGGRRSRPGRTGRLPRGKRESPSLRPERRAN